MMDLLNQYILENFVTRNPERTVTMNDTPRTLSTIARDIRAHWTKPYFGAVPYIDAMRSLSTIDESYGFDDARGIVRYFLANSGTWRGEDARRIKAELKAMLGGK